MPAWGNAGEGQDLDLFDKFLKEWYMAKWIDLLNNLTTTYKLFRRRIVPFKGRRMVIALRTGRSGAVEAVPLSGFQGTQYGAPATVTPGHQPVDNAYVRPKVIMCAIGVPQDVVDTSQGGDRAAFFDAIDFEMMGIKVDCANYKDLMAYRGGRELAILNDPDEDSDATKDDWEVSNIYPFFKNKRVEVWEDYTNSKRTHPAAGYVSVATTNRQHSSGHYLTVDAAVTDAAVSDLIFTKGARGGTGSFLNTTALEMLGLEEIVNNANLSLNNYESSKFYMGQDRTGFEEWNSQVNDINGVLTFEAMQAMVDDIHDNSGGEPTVILTTRATRREYAKKCMFVNPTSEVGGVNFRFVNTAKFQTGMVTPREDDHYAGGNDYLLWDGRLPIIVDRYATHDYNLNDGAMYFIDTRHFYYALVTDWKWWAPEGRILREAQNNLFGVVAHAYIFGELVCDAPNTSGVIKRITVPAA